ncbi:hypothetical protein DL766_006278 [Monosporascus sp. MC13-8B]|uniref:ER-bound oxygenase mpaB/mpaB'/Rubber oxygenase catalytic domain-containing protein n=1 Tax=Monosporascus cannonballus TaxID=155416 RepID=A0ABY0H9I2_9PEZI|nr:hypothetical protein DL762_003847 [Monosporascus cannonballus]RYO92840.1 hypothetical protein DL763_004565 [Monosporascus cannonballus]RYP27683.1 hypothetical protein DL766_006278 [Monosporascus sp. MC13-8B]
MIHGMGRKEIPDDEYGWRNHWGFKFDWTSEHLRPEDLEPLIHTYDVVATECLGRLDEISPPPSFTATPKQDGTKATTKLDGEKHKRRDLYELLREHAATEPKVGRLWDEIHTVPEWVDWEQLERGQKVFFRYAGPILMTLTFVGLLGGMTNGRAVETLDRTGGFGVDAVRRRLLQTMQHVLDVHRDVASIRPGGAGFEDSVRVRLLHAAVRRRILAIQAAVTVSHPGSSPYYDVRALGIPISDLDCVGTINEFACQVVWIGLPRQGIVMRPGEVEDYLALWRYVAYLVGAPHDWLAMPDTARRMMESLIVSEMRPTSRSAALANNILDGLASQPPAYASREFLCAEAWWLNGPEVARALEVGWPGWYYYALVLGQCVFFAVTCYVNRSAAWLDERNIKLVRHILYQVFIRDKSKGGLGYTSKFPLKYHPSFDRPATQRGPGSAIAPDAKRKISRTERMALVSLLLATAIMGTVLWVSVRVVARLVGVWAVG